ncbi:MAG: mandelate racemase/muconate lactonizing enzyme family protein [Spirochaetales bacterium]|nr:mandelate racemase/muconate lactonizing enzyme family protein [Spirochaetales bacterium]
MDKIKDIKTTLFRVPLAEVLTDAMHGNHSHFELITARVTLEDGTEGVGYSYTGGFGGRAVYDVVEYDLKPFLIGEDAACVESLWERMNWKIHYVARGGIASFAVSCIDIALWDIRCKKAGQPLYKMAGGNRNWTKAYYGGIDLNFPLDKLLSNIENQLASGHESIKIKLGQKTLDEDIERIAAVRNLIGPERDFMVDANMSWSVEKAIKATRRMAEYNIYWLEEPTIPDDFPGYAVIAEASPVPIAQGENLHTVYEHRYAMEWGKISFPQPDASNIGGITGWLKVARMAEVLNLPVCTHGMQELHVSLMAGMPNADYLEVHSFPIDQYTKRPLVLKDGLAYAPETPGTGVEFDWNKLEEHTFL